MTSTGPSIRGVCNIINNRSCGSGSICGHDRNGTFVLTNAHVAGTTIGRTVAVLVESLGMRRFNAKVIRAAYSNQVIADWALLYIDTLIDIEPVLLSKDPPAPGESMYTKGFPDCRPHNGTDIEQHLTLRNGVMLWRPDAIGGQSGSGVWSDIDNRQKALLTWSWTDRGRSYGAGQLTSEIWKQNRAAELIGAARSTLPGLVELPGDYDMSHLDRTGLDDPVVENGFFSEPRPMGIQDYPIWYEGNVTPPPSDDDDDDSAFNKEAAIASLTRVRDSADNEIKRIRDMGSDAPIDSNNPDAIHDTFGL